MNGYMFYCDDDNRPQPFEIGQTFEVTSELTIPYLVEDSYQTYIGLKSPITGEEKHFLSSVNTKGRYAKIRSVVEVRREEKHVNQRYGLFALEEQWHSCFICKITLEDLTEYELSFFYISYKSREDAIKRCRRYRKTIVQSC